MLGLGDVLGLGERHIHKVGETDTIVASLKLKDLFMFTLRDGKDHYGHSAQKALVPNTSYMQ